MFYEIKDEKPMKTGWSLRYAAKWWLYAVFSALFLTFTFVIFVFWIGLAVPRSGSVDIGSLSSSSSPERSSLSRTDDRRPWPPSPKPVTVVQPPPPVEYPTAEILKTTVKSKRGRIEMVETSGDRKSGTVSPVRTTRARVEDDFAATSSSYDSKIVAVLAGSTTTRTLTDGINPVEDTSYPAGGGGSVKKKSEAVLPSWYDPNLQSDDAAKSDSASSPPPFQSSNYLKQDETYDLPDFSQIKPDLSAFGMKTIPAFTYLKEPIPSFDNLPDDISSIQDDDEEDNDDDDGGGGVGDDDDDDDDEDIPYRVPSSDNDADVVDQSDTFPSLIHKRLKSVHDWLLHGAKINQTGAVVGGGAIDIGDLLKILNRSIRGKNLPALVAKLKKLYAGLNTTDIQNKAVSMFFPTKTANIFDNSTNLISFGLLAVDLFLLHNVQQIVWNEEANIGEQMLKDPDVIALNALFMSPERIKRLRQTNSRIFTPAADENDKKGMAHDLIEFVNDGLRGVLNLSKAYKSSTSKSKNARSSSSASPLDCIWTVYCRNLDKTAKLHGPYGFLAKINSLGLRLMMGEFPVEKALDRLINEYNNGWGPLNCDKLFPRCRADEAKEVVIQTALGRTTA